MTSVTTSRATAELMTRAAAAWVDSLTPTQLAEAAWPGEVGSPGTEEERLRWFYTPTDHGGLRLNQQRPAQQQLAMRLVASGLSEAGYNTVCTVLGLENILDRVEDWQVDWGRERGRDPGCYYLRVFGQPADTGAWAWRFGGHHVSLNNLVIDGEVVCTTPCFIGADPASSPLLGSAPLRPLAGVEDPARQLLRSLDPERSARALLHPRAPSDIIGGNRSLLQERDQMVRLPDTFRGYFTEQRLVDRVQMMDQKAESGSGYTEADHARLALTSTPQGLPASELDPAQRDLLTSLLHSYVGRVPDELAVPRLALFAGSALDAVHIGWAGGLEPGQPHYYRVQAPGLLLEYDNTQRAVNHVHSVWRDPDSDFGHDTLADHHTTHHQN